MGNDMFNEEQLADAKVRADAAVLKDSLTTDAPSLAEAVREAEEVMARWDVPRHDFTKPGYANLRHADAVDCVLALRSLLAAVKSQPPEIPEAVREAANALRLLLSEPGDLDYPVEDVYSEGPGVDGNGDAPFWSEGGLYGRVGKEAARTLLARHRRATEALAALSSSRPPETKQEDEPINCGPLEIVRTYALTEIPSRPPDSGGARGETEKGGGAMSDERWGYAESKYAESWHECCETREEAIELGRANYATARGHDPFWIHSGHLVSVDSVLPDVDDLLERMGESAYEQAGEAADDYPSVTEEAKEELEALIRAWVEKHAAPNFWVADGTAEFIPAPSPEPAEEEGK